MALITLYDPYEWFDPEKGRQGILVHSSIFDSVLRRRTYTKAVIHETWPEVWEKFDACEPKT